MTADAPVDPAAHIPSVCPVCGAYSLAPENQMSVLLAVCDVLVIKALERLGNDIIRRAPRGERRHQIFGERAKHTAHTVWPADDAYVSKAIRNAWDVVPLLLETHGGCCEYDSARVIHLLNVYVHDLAITQTQHDINELAYRLQSKLGLPVYRQDLTDSPVATHA
jgi:hypothetical protein